MWATALVAVLLLASAEGRVIQETTHILPADPELPVIPLIPADPGLPLEPEQSVDVSDKLGFSADGQLPQGIDTVFALGGGQAGGVQITGMLQNFALDQDPMNMLLDRPKTSYLDISWSNWVDQRLELLDLFQQLMAPAELPRCPHMKSTSALDTGMVSYLASSRFGPAILTTYAQQAGEEQSDFDYDSVNIPAGRPLQRSYEDAFLQEEMSADADKAFEMAALESSMHSQQPNLGYFGANMKSQYQAGWDEESSSQPLIFTRASLYDLMEEQNADFTSQALHQDIKMDEQEPLDRKQLALFILLLAGCCYVWTNLLISCMRLRSQGSDRREAVVTFLIVPLDPEKADSLDKVQFASDYLPAGDISKPLLA